MFFKKKYIGFLYDKNLSGRVYYKKRDGRIRYRGMHAGFIFGKCGILLFPAGIWYDTFICRKCIWKKLLTMDKYGNII